MATILLSVHTLATSYEYMLQYRHSRETVISLEDLKVGLDLFMRERLDIYRGYSENFALACK